MPVIVIETAPWLLTFVVSSVIVEVDVAGFGENSIAMFRGGAATDSVTAPVKPPIGWIETVNVEVPVLGTLALDGVTLIEKSAVPVEAEPTTRETVSECVPGLPLPVTVTV